MDNTTKETKTPVTKEAAKIPVIVKKGFWIDETTKIKKGAEDVSISRQLYDKLVKTDVVERNDPLPE